MRPCLDCPSGEDKPTFNLHRYFIKNMVRLRKLYPHLTKRKTRLLLRSPHYHIRLAAIKSNVRRFNPKHRWGNTELHLGSTQHRIANHIVLSHMQGLPWETYMNRHHHDFTS